METTNAGNPFRDGMYAINVAKPRSGESFVAMNRMSAY
jgi:hypothetical protein